jgi:hypothetical protein
LVTPYAERARQDFTFGKATLDLFDPIFAELGQLTLKFSVVTIAAAGTALGRGGVSTLTAPGRAGACGSLRCAVGCPGSGFGGRFGRGGSFCSFGDGCRPRPRDGRRSGYDGPAFCGNPDGRADRCSPEAPRFGPRGEPFGAGREYGSATACCGYDAGDNSDDDRGGYDGGDDGVLCNGVVGLVGEVGQGATEEAAAVVGAAAPSTSVVGAAVVGVGVAVRRVRRLGAPLTTVVGLAVTIARVHAQSSGVTAGDRVVGRVRVSVDLLGVGEFEEGVVGDEAADRGIVLAGAEVGEARGGVLDAVDEALVAEPSAGGRLGAAGIAEGVEATAYGSLGGGVYGGLGRVVRVGDLPLETAGAGTDRDGLAGPAVVAVSPR